ncbi:hypothetical protein F5Y10DRAFT_273475 [Nemania abortiva]|nr:hypothetical protein F5Y10DRAFT_273475 [Nemania abortiva]
MCVSSTPLLSSSALFPSTTLDTSSLPVSSLTTSLTASPSASSTASSSASATSSSPPPPPIQSTICHGISGDVWLPSRDVAVSLSQQFCAQDSQSVTYNQGTDSEVEFSVTKQNDASLGPADSPNCANLFRATVIDGCDGNDPVNNPHDYKFGGTFLDGDWNYTMTPLSQHINTVSCEEQYDVLFDSFDIHGKNVPDAPFGANGEGLKTQLKQCGDLTSYSFKWTPDDPDGWQWHATGHLPIGTKSCIGTALEEAGGADNGDCRGAG